MKKIVTKLVVLGLVFGCGRFNLNKDERNDKQYEVFVTGMAASKPRLVDVEVQDRCQELLAFVSSADNVDDIHFKTSQYCYSENEMARKSAYRMLFSIENAAGESVNVNLEIIDDLTRNGNKIQMNFATVGNITACGSDFGKCTEPKKGSSLLEAYALSMVQQIAVFSDAEASDGLMIYGQSYWPKVKEKLKIAEKNGVPINDHGNLVFFKFSENESSKVFEGKAQFVKTDMEQEAEDYFQCVDLACLQNGDYHFEIRLDQI